MQVSKYFYFYKKLVEARVKKLLRAKNVFLCSDESVDAPTNGLKPEYI